MKCQKICIIQNYTLITKFIQRIFSKYFPTIYYNEMFSNFIKLSFSLVIPCVGAPVENALISATTLTNRYPVLREFQSFDTNHECVFKPPYSQGCPETCLFKGDHIFNTNF